MRNQLMKTAEQLWRLSARGIASQTESTSDLFLNSPSEHSSPKEIKIPVPWGHISAKEWGPSDGKPVIAAHGWMDNAASFDPLIPLLSPKLRIIAFDFSGHGFSSHRPPGSFYGIFECGTDILRVADYAKMDKFTLMGHSFGSNVGVFLSAMFPERMPQIIGIDFIGLGVYNPDMMPNMMKDVIKLEFAVEKRKLKAKTYDLQDAIDRVYKANFGLLSKESIKILFTRGALPVDGGKKVELTRDDRLRTCRTLHSSAYYELKENAKAYKGDVLTLLTDDEIFTLGKDYDREFRDAHGKNCRHCEFYHLDGPHYIHLNEPVKVAPYINRFLKRTEELDRQVKTEKTASVKN